MLMSQRSPILGMSTGDVIGDETQRSAFHRSLDVPQLFADATQDSFCPTNEDQHQKDALETQKRKFLERTVPLPGNFDELLRTYEIFPQRKRNDASAEPAPGSKIKAGYRGRGGHGYASDYDSEPVNGRGANADLSSDSEPEMDAPPRVGVDDFSFPGNTLYDTEWLGKKVPRNKRSGASSSLNKPSLNNRGGGHNDMGVGGQAGHQDQDTASTLHMDTIGRAGGCDSGSASLRDYHGGTSYAADGSSAARSSCASSEAGDFSVATDAAFREDMSVQEMHGGGGGTLAGRAGIGGTTGGPLRMTSRGRAPAITRNSNSVLSAASASATVRRRSIGAASASSSSMMAGGGGRQSFRGSISGSCSYNSVNGGTASTMTAEGSGLLGVAGGAAFPPAPPAPRVPPRMMGADEQRVRDIARSQPAAKFPSSKEMAADSPTGKAPLLASRSPLKEAAQVTRLPAAAFSPIAAGQAGYSPPLSSGQPLSATAALIGASPNGKHQQVVKFSYGGSANSNKLLSNIMNKQGGGSQLQGGINAAVGGFIGAGVPLFYPEDGPANNSGSSKVGGTGWSPSKNHYNDLLDSYGSRGAGAHGAASSLRLASSASVGALPQHRRQSTSTDVLKRLPNGRVTAAAPETEKIRQQQSNALWSRKLQQEYAASGTKSNYGGGTTGSFLGRKNTPGMGGIKFQREPLHTSSKLNGGFSPSGDESMSSVYPGPRLSDQPSPMAGYQVNKSYNQNVGGNNNSNSEINAAGTSSHQYQKSLLQAAGFVAMTTQIGKHHPHHPRNKYQTRAFLRFPPPTGGANTYSAERSDLDSNWNALPGV
ncbi:unnamed protein product [Amoebophrya sp. A25]|nr:unnamed protein product [Amoebophrya sp. A25]|eukprot:GSA25T00016539001.1